MRTIDHSYQVLYSELAQRALDSEFMTGFSVTGRFVQVEVKGLKYWYFDEPKQGGGQSRRYVGPAADQEITQRVEQFANLKQDARARRKLVSTLVREAYLPRPNPLSGEVIQTLAEAGFFRLRGVLIGTTALQTYAGLLGVRLNSMVLQTGDADFAQFHAISAAVADSLPPMIDLLRRIDPTFREIPHEADSRRATAYVTRSGYRVEFLTPNTGSADNDGHPADMPALGGASATPLRFLDFLIHEPVRAVLLHKSGVPVLVPAPARYAIHKLIVASRRRSDDDGTAKQRKDLQQAFELAEALAYVRQADDLADAVQEAFGRGSHWQDAVLTGLKMMPETHGETFRQIVRDGFDQLAESLPTALQDT